VKGRGRGEVDMDGGREGGRKGRERKEGRRCSCITFHDKIAHQLNRLEGGGASLDEGQTLPVHRVTSKEPAHKSTLRDGASQLKHVVVLASIDRCLQQKQVLWL
jgi:hypothetical protein